MGAAQVLQDLQAAGFTLTAEGERLTVTPGAKLADADRENIRAHKRELLALLIGPPQPSERATAAANDAGSTDTPTDHRSGALLARMARLGWPEARALPVIALLKQRDAQDDDRRMCVECSHLGDMGRCLAASAGRLPHADRRHEPVPDVLQRCEAFGLRKGMR